MYLVHRKLKSPPGKKKPRFRDKGEIPTFDMVATINVKFMFGIEDSLARNSTFAFVIWKFL